jgi:hypothetical protein
MPTVNLSEKIKFPNELRLNDPASDPQPVKNSDTTPASALVEMVINQYFEIERHTPACKEARHGASGRRGQR